MAADAVVVVVVSAAVVVAWISYVETSLVHFGTKPAAYINNWRSLEVNAKA